MRALAEQIIQEAAVAAGVPAERVGRVNVDKDEILLKRPRVDIQILAEKVTPKARKLAKELTEDGAYRAIVRQTHERSLSIRAELVWDGDEEALEAAATAFLLALPHKVADGQGNLVKISPSKAERSGFVDKLVEVPKKRSIALHITFTGRITREEQIGMITDVNLVDGVNYKETDNG